MNSFQGWYESQRFTMVERLKGKLIDFFGFSHGSTNGVKAQRRAHISDKCSLSEVL